MLRLSAVANILLTKSVSRKTNRRDETTQRGSFPDTRWEVMVKLGARKPGF